MNLKNIFYTAAAVAFMFSTGCKKKEENPTTKRSVLSIGNIKLSDLSSGSTSSGEFFYDVTIARDNASDTTMSYSSAFAINNGYAEQASVSFDTDLLVKSIKAKCTIKIEGGTAQKLTVGSFRLVTEGVETINHTNLSYDFSSDFYLVGAYTGTY